ncbi:MAG: aminopeptidase [Treponema sp.]|nr:aminopeptidase [Treponema sp.]
MKYIKFYHLPILLNTVLIILFCTVLPGCYTLTQGMTMLGYLNQAIPLEQVDDEEFVKLVLDIRRFASEELGLAMSKNYTNYVELDRNYLAAVVSASARDSFRRHEWNYPIVGRLPYKGFFNVEDARKEREKLEKKDLDVWIRGVDAFSTLGWFKDPLFSYMRNYTPSRLADLIIHEQVHATVFLKGQVQFNEELATFIGGEGSRIFIKNRYGEDSKEYQDMFTSDTNSQNYIAFIQELIAELNVMYTSNISREEKLLEKDRIINNAKERFAAEYENLFTNDNYRFFIDLPINNAYLELFRLYHAADNFYADLYERSGSDLPTFIAAAKSITARGGNPREQLEKALGIQ